MPPAGLRLLRGASYDSLHKHASMITQPKQKNHKPVAPASTQSMFVCWVAKSVAIRVYYHA